MTNQRWIVVFIVLYMLTFNESTSKSQEASSLPFCSERPTLNDVFQVDPFLFCLEAPLSQEESTYGQYTSLVFDDDNRLYATNPLDGEVVVFTDENNADYGLVDTKSVLISDLEFPHGLSYSEGTLYILGNGIVYSYNIASESLIIIADDIPPNRPFASRAILVDEEFIYIGIPANCDLCMPEEENTLRGTVIRTELDGTNRTIIGRGLRYPTSLAIYDNQLLVTDIAADYHNIGSYFDEINTIDLSSESNTSPHFGFPHCYGLNITENQIETTFNCDDATPPAYHLPTKSQPYTITTYQGNTFEWLQDSFLLALLDSGGGNVMGNAIFGITPTANDTVIYDGIAPSNFQTGGVVRVSGLPRTAILPYHTERVNRTGFGIFPEQVYSVAVDENGWIYFTTSFNGLHVLRPRIHPQAYQIRCTLGLYCEED